MKIQILGSGCPRCKKLYETAETAVKEAGIQADLIKITDIDEIIGFGVMMTPGLAIDGDVKSSGKLPTKEEIVNWLKSV